MKKHFYNHQTVFMANKNYYNIVAENYFKNEAYAYTKEIRCSVKELLSIGAENASGRDLFLDFGCGSGFLSFIVAENKIMNRGIGIDASESQVLLYNKNLEGTNFKAETGDINNLRFNNESFDMAGGYSVPHHLFDYYAALKEITRVLKSGGVLYIDFEPNRLFKLLFKIPIATRRRFFDRAPTEEKLENIAEYHNNYQPGISRKSLINFLSDNYEIIKTGNRIPATTGMNIFTILSRISFAFAPDFYVVAKKR